jgi:hypothetical protein
VQEVEDLVKEVEGHLVWEGHLALVVEVEGHLVWVVEVEVGHPVREVEDLMREVEVEEGHPVREVEEGHLLEHLMSYM